MSSDENEVTAPRTLRILNNRGLHARASAKFVKCADAFDARVSVTKDGQTVGGTSIMGLMMLGAARGSSVELSAKGTDADAALNALEALINGRFGED
ncbi:MAG: HPr family phosphocarrier protein [Hyphomicrobiales bacterium]